MKKLERLIKEGNDIYIMDFKSAKAAKQYARKVVDEINAYGETLIEKKKELEQQIYELEKAQKTAFDFWLNIR